MPRTTKKQRLEDDHQDPVAASGDFVASFDDLTDVLPNIYGFLSLQDIMRSRRINKTSREAVKMTIVPPTDFCVDSVDKYNAMNVMTRALPNLQHFALRYLGIEHKWSDGEDPDEEYAAETADRVSHDIEKISNFSKLRVLKFYSAFLNGRYPILFNSFPLLQKLSIDNCRHLKWDLEMLAGLPLLKELDCEYNYHLTGNINSLRVLKDTLEKVKIICSCDVEGNFFGSG